VTMKMFAGEMSFEGALGIEDEDELMAAHPSNSELRPANCELRLGRRHPSSVVCLLSSVFPRTTDEDELIADSPSRTPICDLRTP